MTYIKLDVPDLSVNVEDEINQTRVILRQPATIINQSDMPIYEFAETSLFAITASYALNVEDTAAFPFTGSAEILGSLQVLGGTISGSFVGDASGLTGVSASALAGGVASYIPIWNTNTTLSASALYETSQDLIITKPITLFGNQVISGSLVVTDNVLVTGRVTANELVVSSVISSSIIYESGSTQFGNTIDDTHQFTGSIFVDGPMQINQLITGSIVQALSASYIDGGYY